VRAYKLERDSRLLLTSAPPQPETWVVAYGFVELSDGSGDLVEAHLDPFDQGSEVEPRQHSGRLLDMLCAHATAVVALTSLSQPLGLVGTRSSRPRILVA
jgi:hypothetical protein